MERRPVKDRVYIVFLQRYPDEGTVQRTFESRADALRFLDAKQEDYRYTVGKAWMKTYTEE
jgi:hypothetical protein